MFGFLGAPNDSSNENIKSLFDELKIKKHESHLLNRKIYMPYLISEKTINEFKLDS